MTTPTSWTNELLNRIATADDLHIAPRRTNGETGTPTWIWSVAVDDTLYVRPYHGSNSSWYQSALQTGSGVIESGGTTYDVRFAPVDDDELLARVDAAYAAKYDGSPYLSAMVEPGPRATTIAVTPDAWILFARKNVAEGSIYGTNPHQQND
jgi:hypothetical protein